MLRGEDGTLELSGAGQTYSTPTTHNQVGGLDRVLTNRQACCLFSQAADAGAADWLVALVALGGQPASRMARPVCRWRRPQSTRVGRRSHTASRNQVISESGTPASGCEHLQRRVAQHALYPLWICLPPKGAFRGGHERHRRRGGRAGCVSCSTILLGPDPMQAGARDLGSSSPRWTSRHGGYHVVEEAGRRRAAAREKYDF